MNENIDLTKILKDCPKGWKFYSTLYGKVEFEKIKKESEYPIVIITKHGNNSDIKSDGRYYGEYDDGECTLFPSKYQRDWSKFTAPWYNGKNEQKSTDKIESRFKVGDWVVRGDTIAQILDIQEQYYVGLDINGKDFVSSRFLNSDKIHLWTIQDAKDGDVLCCKSGWMCIFKSLNNHTNTFSSYCFMDSYKYFFNSGSECHTLDKEFINAYNGEIHPATKEQHDTFMKAMNDAGYEWDAEKKKLKKLVTNRFDPNTLQPFDKVLVKDFDETSYWTCNLFSHYNKNKGFYYCSSVPFDVCIPYNDNTKHLVGTTDEAPKFYKYWEE